MQVLGIEQNHVLNANFVKQFIITFVERCSLGCSVIVTINTTRLAVWWLRHNCIKSVALSLSELRQTSSTHSGVHDSWYKFSYHWLFTTVL